jgi:LysM repeat protein
MKAKIKLLKSELNLMKKLLFWFLAALAFGGTLGMIMWHVRSAQRAAIREALAERDKAHEVFQDPHFVHIVQPGETLLNIANQMGTTVPVLRSGNDLPLFGRVLVGQKLINPQAKYVFEDYGTALDKIDPSACPKDFQDAWMDYVGSWDLKNDPYIKKENLIDEAPTKQATHLGVSVGLTTSVQIGKDIERANLHEVANRLEQLDNAEAWLKCKRVASNYGVFVP